METQKILKPVGKIVIISDYREKDVIELLKKTDAIVNEMNLEVGDFLCSDGTAWISHGSGIFYWCAARDNG